MKGPKQAGATRSTKKIGDGYTSHNMKPSASSTGANVKDSALNPKDSYKCAKTSK